VIPLPIANCRLALGVNGSARICNALLGAFTRHPAGLLGQPFYGWSTNADTFFQAASAALFGEGRLKRPKNLIVAPPNQP
jgi:hypothetical protein